ncbi:MAG: ABC transporter permease [Eubacteriaceae bacterium]|nr:ABC transporter permease [Eubacteriaceae bacterium]
MFGLIKVIVQKELKRVFTDRRLVFTTLILPPIMLVVIYWMIGLGIGSLMTDIDKHVPIVYLNNAPVAVIQQIQEAGGKVTKVTDKMDSNEIKESIKAAKIDVYIDFDPQFETKISNYQDTEVPTPNVNTYYNSSEEYSSAAYSIVRGVLENYENTLLGERFSNPEYANVFDLDKDNKEHILIDEKKASGKMLSSLLPMLITIFLFSGAMALGPDSIAGEKERGTMATLLMTPVKRDVIAFGKVISLGILAFLSALSSFVGIIIALPLLANSYTGGMDLNITDYVKYGFYDFAMLLLVLIAMEGIFVGLISVASVIARNVKEAGTYILPIYFLVMIASFSNMYSTQVPSDIEYAIPIYGNVLAIKNILTYSLSTTGFFLSIGVSLVLTVALVYLIKILFEKESVMFN